MQKLIYLELMIGWTHINFNFKNIQKIGNTREQLFHAWQSFHFDENTYDTYEIQGNFR